MEASPIDTTQPATSTEPKIGCCNLRTSDWLKLISNIAIPLIIGIFTVIVAIHQESVARSNRDKDTVLAAQARQEALNITLRDRAEDKKTAEKLRDEDKESARLRREDDKEIARLQRELDLNMTTDKLNQESKLAEKQRNLSESQHTHEIQMSDQNHISDLSLEDDRQKETILVNYQQQLATLLLKYGSPVDNPYGRLRFVIQMKTRAALRLLNPARRTILVRTLYQADLFKTIWKKENSFLYRANVSGIHFGHPPDNYEYDTIVMYDYLDIEAADARYASFRYVYFLHSSSFDYTNLDYTDWSFAQLLSVDFRRQTTMNGAIFFRTDFLEVSFNEINMDQVSFQNNKKCDTCIFEKTSLLGVRLDNAQIVNSNFSLSRMADANMSNGSFIGSIFQNVILDRVILSGANLLNCVFQNVSMIDCLLYGTVLSQAVFSIVNMTGCRGLLPSQMFSMLYYNRLILPNGTLIDSNT